MSNLSPQQFRLHTDLDRAEGVIRLLRLKGPHDGPEAFSVPPQGSQSRLDLADVVYDLADQHAARAILDAPNKHKVYHR